MYSFIVPWYCELCYTTASQEKREQSTRGVGNTDTTSLRITTQVYAVVYVVIPSSLS